MSKRPGTLAPREYEREKREREREAEERARSRSGGHRRATEEEWLDEEDRLDFADPSSSRRGLPQPSHGYSSSSLSSTSSATSLSNSSNSNPASNSTIRKRWEIRSSEVIRDGEKLGQGGFGAVYKG
ncbi:uncharacterized protein ACA1_295870 [Acanthamoeba castellanii str. Neff]|uniref:Uncharacterized protein n=1 Tax=Acanthamoeba castellanii (strain ATCC 30010 / Neff) TaxID=1257118 RepID=L8HJW5_ACACF|nr:uncharacterized protein ACA1_295870 [Acanthamoeba castellanii str. Neff]ELR25500.1 hypothetical protein ACA1_295870 [Acanthamoeba castellanii str. Neff]